MASIEKCDSLDLINNVQQQRELTMGKGMENLTNKNEPAHEEQLPAALQNIMEEIREKKKQAAPIKAIKGSEGNEINIDVTKMELQTFQTFGTVDADCMRGLLNQVILAHPEINKTDIAGIINKTTPLLHAIAPRDELEGMLAVQMVSVHNLAMEMMKRAVKSALDSNVLNRNVTMVTKLNRTFIAQIEALNKHRGKGQQKMTVEYVHVGDGGQAVIGNVERGEGGGK